MTSNKLPESPQETKEILIQRAAELSGIPAEDITVYDAIRILSIDHQDPALMEDFMAWSQGKASAIMYKAMENHGGELAQAAREGRLTGEMFRNAMQEAANELYPKKAAADQIPAEIAPPGTDPAPAVIPLPEYDPELDPESPQFNPEKWEEYEAEAMQEVKEAMAILQGFVSNLTTKVKSIQDFFTSGAGQAIREAVTSITKAAPAFIEIAREFGELIPFIEKELEKPQYEGKTVHELLQAAELDENGEPTEKSLFSQALAAAREAKEKADGKTKLRTVKNAGDVSRILKDRLAITTIPGYLNALSLLDNGKAYLRTTDMSALTFNEGKLYFAGNPVKTVGEMELKNLQTKEDIENINLPFLQFLYTELFAEWENAIRDKATGQTEEIELPFIKKFYLPDLARARGLPANASGESMEAIKNDITAFHNVVGVLKEQGYKDPSYYPVLNFEGYDATKNTISISSPYLMHIVETIFRESVRRDRNGRPKLRTDGTPQTKPANTYLVHSDIQKERNKAAVQNVFLLVQSIERRGGKRGELNTFHIEAKTLINRNTLLKERLSKNKNKRRTLQTCFKKTWELLRTKTDLELFYPGIELPDPENPASIPTYKGLSDFVININHYGKVDEKQAKNSQQEGGGQAVKVR